MKKLALVVLILLGLCGCDRVEFDSKTGSTYNKQSTTHIPYNDGDMIVVIMDGENR